jgi:hypothetical protein
MAGDRSFMIMLGVDFLMSATRPRKAKSSKRLFFNLRGQTIRTTSFLPRERFLNALAKYI